MTMIDQAFASLKATASKSVKAKPQTGGKRGKRTKAAKSSIARQKANQRSRKASGSSRNFKLTPKALKEFRAEAGKRFINPYRPGSLYHLSIAAFQQLGANRWYSLEKLTAAIESRMGSDAVKAFKAKQKRNPKTGKSWKERLIQNVKVLARPDYGMKLRQVGHEIRTDRTKGAGLFKVASK